MVDGVQHTAAQQRDMLHALHQQQTGHLTAAAHLVMVNGKYLIVLRLTDGDKRHLARLQQRDQGVTLQCAGQDQTIDFAVIQQSFHRTGFVFAHQRQQDIVVGIPGNLIDRAHHLAQKGQLKVGKLRGNHQRNIVGAALHQPARHHTGGIVMLFYIVQHALAGCCADAPVAGYGTGHGCLGYAKRLRDLRDIDRLVVLRQRWHGFSSPICIYFYHNRFLPNRQLFLA